MCELVDKSNFFFKELTRKGCISEKTLKYFTYEFKNSTNLGKLYLLPKIHKRLENVPRRPVISNCGTPTEEISEFLDFHLKSAMQNGASYVRDSNDFKNKIKNIKIPNNALLVTTDVVGLYPSIPHESGLNAFREALEQRSRKEIPTENLIKMAEFVLKNNFSNLTAKFFNRLQGLLLGQSLHHLTRVFLWTNWEPNFWKLKHLSL